MRNPFWRQSADFIVTSLDRLGHQLNGVNWAVAFSGRGGPYEAAMTEPPHVSVYLISPTGHWRKTDLNGAGGVTVQIQTSRSHDPGDPMGPDGIYRGWNLGPDPAGNTRLVNALNEATALEASLGGRNTPYAKYSFTCAKSWNCADYAEKILRAAGLNVSAGFFISSPLELTTGSSLPMRAALGLLSKATCCVGPNEPWYKRFKH